MSLWFECRDSTWTILLAISMIAAGVACAGEEEKNNGGEDGEAEKEVTDLPAEDEQETEPGNQCVSDEDCNDHIDCTTDRCSNGYCRNMPDDGYCDDGLKCNGKEICHVEEGCLPGEIFRGCNDGNSCTMDLCVEGLPGQAPTCQHPPLDRDRDGHVDIHCPEYGGDDCNDLSDRVYPGAREYCFDNLDNDCNGGIDFNDEQCSLTNDSCATPLQIFPGVREEGFTLGATADIDSSCDSPDWPDAAFFFVLENPSDVRLTITGRDDFYPYAAIQRECGQREQTLRCGSDQPFTFCRRGMDAGTYYVVVSSWDEGIFDIRLDVTPPGPPPAGDSCSNPISITGDGHLEGDLVCMEDDLRFECTPWANWNDMFFTFSLTEMKDVLIRASAILFSPYITLYQECTNPTPAIFCDSGYPFERRVTRLEPGNYTIGVESYTPGQFALDINFLPPSQPPENETCEGAIDVSSGGVFAGSLLAARDDYSGTCTGGYLDVFYRFSLTETKDVEIVSTGSGMFEPSLVLMRVCGDPISEVTCRSITPADIYLRSLPAGDYWIAVEAPYGGDFNLEVIFFPPTSACESLTVIDTSTTVTDTTTGRPNDFESSCGGNAMSPDRPYILRLTAPANVTAQITAASFDTVLHLRSLCDDPSSQIACDDDGAGYPLSLLQLEPLDIGDYYLIVDGFGSGSAGDYTLQVTINPL